MDYETIVGISVKDSHENIADYFKLIAKSVYTLDDNILLKTEEQFDENVEEKVIVVLHDDVSHPSGKTTIIDYMINILEEHLCWFEDIQVEFGQGICFRGIILAYCIPSTRNMEFPHIDSHFYDWVDKLIDENRLPKNSKVTCCSNCC